MDPVQNSSDLESMLLIMDSKELKEDLLDKISFIRDNMSQPKDYYKGTNSKIEEINSAIDDIWTIYTVLFSEDNEDILKKLYTHCSSKEAMGESYKLFYTYLQESLNIWHYGERIQFIGGSLGEYTSLKRRLYGLTKLLETGELPNLSKKAEEYRKELGDKSGSQYQ